MPIDINCECLADSLTGVSSNRLLTLNTSC